MNHLQEGGIVQFHCSMVSNNRKYSWPGKVQVLGKAYPCEAIVESDGYSYHMIIGHYQNGYYLCIPSLKIGIDIAHPGDGFWNTESMIRSGISKKRTTLFVQALAAIEKYMKE